MRKRNQFLIFFTLTVAMLSSQNSYDVIHDSPASSWREASVMGNGRIGAMVEGGISREVILINEDTLWSGEPTPHMDGTKARKSLSKIRDLLFKGKHNKATKLGMKTLLGKYNQCYQPAGQLIINQPNIKNSATINYKRSLNLNKAVTTTLFEENGVLYTREIFVSHPDNVLIVKLSASKKGALNAEISLESLLENNTSILENNLLIMNGRAPIHATPHYMKFEHKYDESKLKKGMRFSLATQVKSTDGQISTKDNNLLISNATQAVICLTVATSYNGFENSPSQNGKDSQKIALKDLSNLKNYKYNSLLNRHINDYSALFSKVSIELGDSKKSKLPISKRVGKKYVDGADPDLDELFYQFGRYLLISSSREGSQPTNLQGIWSYKISPAWSSNWTVNCNTQFNYIGSGASGLVQLNEPYLRMIEEASIDGAKVAKSWYGTGGWVFHHNLDLWRSAIPVGGDVLWATFPTASAWCVVELYDNWKFSNNANWLKRINHLQEGSVQFWLENLVKHPKSGKFISSPDVYFENPAIKKSGEKVVLCSGPVASTILIKQLFLDYIESSNSLELGNKNKIDEVKKMISQMAEIKIKKNGEINQWHDDFNENWKETDSTQLLVMVGAIYSNQIHPEKSPELANSLLNMLKKRSSKQDGQGSWRAAFPANSYARLGKGDLTKKVLNRIYKKAVNPNLTTNFLGVDWEIDGNLGLMGAMQECLLQSHTDEIVLLPALPSQWAKKGSVKGLMARGGYTLNFSWKKGVVTEWNIQGKKGSKVNVRINGESQTLIIK